MNGGVKELHLIAEPVEVEFAPGMKVKAWGCNGSMPGPTIEAVEGDRVRIFVENRRDGRDVHGGEDSRGLTRAEEEHHHP